jgi:hypothetical protein
VNGDGTVTVYARTSTVSGSGDEGADPNKVVAVTDTLRADSLSPRERFQTVAPARYGVRYGGVAVLSKDLGAHGRQQSSTRRRGWWRSAPPPPTDQTSRTIATTPTTTINARSALGESMRP